MTRFLTSAAALALFGLIFSSPVAAQRGGGGGGGGRGFSGGGFSGGGARSAGGGFSGGRASSGFGGSRMGGGGLSTSRPGGSFGASRMGGLGSSSFRSSASRSPSFGNSSPRSSLGSSGLRTSPSLGNLRVSPRPSIGSIGSPQLRPANTPRLPTAGNRPSAQNPAASIAPRVLDSRPNLNPGANLNLGSPATRNLPNRSPGDLRNDSLIRGRGPGIGEGLAQPAPRTNPGVISRSGREGVSLGNANPVRNADNARNGVVNPNRLGRPIDLSSRGANTSLRPTIDSGPGRGGASGGNVASRVTPQNLDNFLALRGNNAAAGFRNANIGPVNSVSRTNINNNFRNLNVTQINRINNNINVGIRNFNGSFVGNINNGFGYSWRNPHWNNWAGGVRSHWSPWRYHNCFTPRFWATNFCSFPWRRSYYWWGAQPWTSWWSAPSWGGLCNWFPSYGWSSPNYYGYGLGGNVVFNAGHVYMNDLPIATVEDYAASAAELATIPTPPEPDKPVEWMPLGTFALSRDATDTTPERVLQLAVDKDGILSGTMFNETTKQSFPVQGRVDKATQRVAFTIGDNKDVVFETGIYNLTQQQTPVLALGGGLDETYLLLRLDAPKSADTKTGSAAPATTAKPPLTDEPIPPPPPAPGLPLDPEDRVR